MAYLAVFLRNLATGITPVYAITWRPTSTTAAIDVILSLSLVPVLVGRSTKISNLFV